MIVGLAFGRFLVVFSCARDVGLFLVLFASPGCGVLLGCFGCCARMRVLGVGFFLWFDLFFVLVVPVCGCLSAVYQVYFCIGLMPLFLCFWGVLSVFRFLGSFDFECILCWVCPFGNKFLFIQKKKKSFFFFLFRKYGAIYTPLM